MNKIDLFQAYVYENNLDIIVLNETWLKSYIPDSSLIENFIIYRKDRHNSRGGGVLIGIKDNYKSIEISTDNEYEDIYVEMFVSTKKLLLVTLYKPPQLLINFRKYLENRFNNININNYDAIIFFGDLNINFDMNNKKKDFIDLKNNFLFYGLKQIVQKPTYPVNNPRSIIDLVFTNNINIINSIEICNNMTLSCDHMTILGELSLSNEVISQKSHFYRKYNQNNLMKLNVLLQGVNWFEITERIDDIDIIYTIINDKYNECLNDCVPFFEHHPRSHKPFSFEIRKLINIRRKLNKNRNSISNFIDKYLYLTDLIGYEISQYESNKIINMIDNNNNFHKLYKHIHNKTKNQSAKSFIDKDGNRIYDKNEIVETFKNMFKLKYTRNGNFQYNLNIKNNNEILDNIVFNMNKLVIAMKKFNYKKSQGKTFLDNVVLKNCLNGSCKLLFCLFSRIFEFQKIPQEMKISIVSPIVKSGCNKNSFQSHRCVTIQPNIYRIFEILLSLDIFPFLYSFVIPDCQYGYKPKSGIKNIHIDLQNIINNTFNNKEYYAIDVIFLDMSDAFDTVNRSLLLSKLESFGIKGEYLRIISDSLYNRKQYVKFENTFSKQMNITSGVPQGGVLSPVLYNAYTADMKDNINSHLFNFADDTIIIRPIFEITDCHHLQNDINNIVKYFKSNNLKLNSAKCKFMRITNKKTIIFNYKIDNVEILQVKEQKYIGVIYDEKMTFNSHINYITEKALKKFYTMRFLGKSLNGSAMIKLYKTYILPIIEYSNLCLTMTKTQTTKIEKIQRKISRYLCSKFSIYDLNYKNRIEFLGLKSLELRNVIQMMKYIYKLKTCHPDIKQSLINQINFSMCNNECFAQSRANRIKLSDKYIISYCCKLFNNLPVEIRNECKYNVFMYLLYNYLNL